MRCVTSLHYEFELQAKDMPTSSPRSIAPSASSRLSPPWRIGVDVGGTFTDLAIIDADGSLHIAKVPSTPSDPSEGVLTAVETIATQTGLTVCKLLECCSYFVHGSTIATNVVVERRGAPTGLIVSRGFRDSLEIRRGIRHNAWDHRRPFPPVLVPRYLRLPVGGRLDRHGVEIEALSLEEVDKAIDVFRRESISSVAICLYNSFLSDAHEVGVAARIREVYPDCWVTLSSHVAPIMGEYERSSTAVISAYIAPGVVAYMERIAATLRERGLRVPLLVVQNNGGSLPVRARARATGSAAAVRSCGRRGRAGVVRRGAGNAGSALDGDRRHQLRRYAALERRHAEIAPEFDLGGYHVALPSVDIHSIGAGGGTIAAVDAAGMLFVGPRGAGADPGPASYDRGGTDATVTDAQLVLGRLKPGPLAGGRSLDIGLARAAIEQRIARPLGLSVDEAAAGIVTLVEQQLFQAVQKISAERGHDPRRFVLVAAGGAGPMHGSSIGRKLGSPAVYVPRLAGAFCALGMLDAPIKHEYSRVVLGEAGPVAMPSCARPRAAGATAPGRNLRRDGFAADEMEFVHELELRHPGQIGAIRVAVSRLESPLRRGRRRAISGPLTSVSTAISTATRLVEIAALFVVGIGRLPRVRLEHLPESDRNTPKPTGSARLLCAGGRTDPDPRLSWHAICFRRRSFADLPSSRRTTTSVVVAPGDICSVDALGNYVIRFEGAARA